MKTISLKKVSAVAVASLGFGLMSVVPAQAAYITANITSLNATRATTTPTVGTAVVVNLGAVIPSATYVVGNQVLFQAQFTSVPTGGEVAISGALTVGTAAAAATYPTGLAGTAVAGAGTGKLELVASATTAGSTITSSATVGFGSFTF